MELWKEVLNNLQENYPESLKWNSCDEALIGVVGTYRDNEWVNVALYDYDTLIEIFHRDFKKEQEENENPDPESDPYTDALEWVEYNILTAYIGKYTPMYLVDKQITGVLDTKQPYN